MTNLPLDYHVVTDLYSDFASISAQLIHTGGESGAFHWQPMSQLTAGFLLTYFLELYSSGINDAEIRIDLNGNLTAKYNRPVQKLGEDELTVLPNFIAK